MDTTTVFGVQFLLSLGLSGLLAAWYLSPWLAKKPLELALAILLIPHATRHLGLVFLVPGVVDPGMPGEFAASAAYGDLAAGVLAILAMIALRAQWRTASAFVWIFSLVGIADLATALLQIEVVPYFGAAWYIPTFVVPVLLVTHAMIVVRLISHARGDRAHRDPAIEALVM